MATVTYIQKDDIRDLRAYHMVSHDRWQNAVNCFYHADYLASLYLAGYSVECILKYVIIKKLFF